MAQNFAQPVENLSPSISPMEAGTVAPNQVNIKSGDIESLKISLNFSLEKLNEFQTTVAQNLENIGTELVNAPVWSDEERLSVSDAFVESHQNYYEYVKVIDALEEQSRLLLEEGQDSLKEDGLSHVFDAYANLNHKLTSYKVKMKTLMDSLAKLQATLPNASVAESSKGEYEELTRNSLASVNNFILEGVNTLAIKDNAESAEDKKHNLEINFIYNLYNKEDFKNLSGSFIALENKVLAMQKAIADKTGNNIMQVAALMKENTLDLPKEIQDLFLIKNYFDLHPGWAEKIEKKVQYLEYTKNELLKKYNSEKDLALLKTEISNPDYYNAVHLREFVKDRIINDPVEVMSSLDEKLKTLVDFREKEVNTGGKEMLVENLDEAMPMEAFEESVDTSAAPVKETVATNKLEDEFFAKGDKMNRVGAKIAAKLEDQSKGLEIEEMPTSEYEESFWQANQGLKISYDNYLADLTALGASQSEDIKVKLNKVAETTKDYFKKYIADNYAVFSAVKMKEDLEKYLVDQRVALEQVREALGATKEIELDESDIIYDEDKADDLTAELQEASKEDIVDAFWKKHKDVETKMEKVVNDLMLVKNKILEARPGLKLDDWTANSLMEIENYIGENYAKKSEAEIVSWINNYLDQQLENVKALDLEMQKPDSKGTLRSGTLGEEVIPITDDQIISVEDAVPSTADLSFAKKKKKEDEIELDASDIIYDEEKTAVPPPIPAAALRGEAAQAASALASFEKTVPAEEKAKELHTLGELAKVSPADTVAEPLMDMNSEELDKAMNDLFDNSDFIADLPDMPKKKVEGQAMASGSLETDMSTVKDLGIKKKEKKVIAPPDSVPFTSVEEEFFAKGEWNDYKKKVEIALEKNKRIFEWVQSYLEIKGYKKLDLNQIINTLANDEFFDIVNDALLLFDRFEQYNEESELNDLKVSAEDISSKSTMRRIKVGDEYFSFKPEDYLKLINLRIKYLEESLKKNIRWRDASKKDKAA